jgi:putative ABC transport system permease protein
MSTTAQIPPAPAEAPPAVEHRPSRPGNGGRAARRALLRWAVRLFRREWRQQVLVLALLAVAVAATIGGIALAINASPSQASELGSANHILVIDGSAPRLADDVAAVRSTFGAADAIAHDTLALPGSVATVDLRDQDPSGVFGHSMLRLDDGHYPTTAGEIAVTDHVASLLGLRVGATIVAGGRSRQVVGIVENPQKLSDEFALVAPGQLDRPNHVSVLVDATQDQLERFRLPDGSGLSLQSYSTTAASQAAAIVLAIATIGMLFVGLLAVAGFNVMAQRRLRSIGMLGAIGATDRHVRLVMLGNGAVVGVVAAAAGSIVGFVSWIVAAPHLEHLVDHRIARFDLPWWALAATLALAIVTAIGSAWWPARTAARIPVVAALSGRPPRPQPSRRFAAAGIVLAASGYTMLALAHQRGALLIIGGTLMTMVGVLLLAPLAIRALKLFAGRAPVAIRLALRDLVRYQSRSGAAVGAVALALGIAAMISISAAAADASAAGSAGRGNLPSNEMIVYSGDRHGGPVAIASDTALEAAQAAVQGIATAIQASTSTALQQAVDPTARDISADGTGASGTPPAALVKVTPVRKGIDEALVADLYVATPELLHFDGIDPATVGPAADVLTPRHDLGGTEIGSASRTTLAPSFQRLDLPAYTSEPTTMITTAAISKLGLQPTTVAWALRTPASLTDVQIAAASHAAAAAGLSIETRSSPTSYGQLRTDSTAIGVLVALAVLAMTVGLIRSETAGDVRTLSATGASSHTRRMITGATAGALGLLGGVLGSLGAYLALLAWHHGKFSSLADPPIVDLLVIVVGLPLIAALGGWLLAGPEPAVIARAPLT